MKKILITGMTLILLTSCASETENTANTETTNTVIQNTGDRNEEIKNLQPQYKADLYGKVKSIEGNMFTITEIDLSKDPTAGMESTEKRAYMQALSEADRVALKESIASATLGDIKVMIPVGIPMVKKELSGEEKVDVEATLADLKTGDIVSIWYNKEVTDRKISSYVKRSFRR